jgi:hypothetical protein
MFPAEEVFGVLPNISDPVITVVCSCAIL